jgi:hypothetical protein
VGAHRHLRAPVEGRRNFGLWAFVAVFLGTALTVGNVWAEVSRRRERKPSRQRMNSMRESAVAVPRALAKALTITPRSSRDLGRIAAQRVYSPNGVEGPFSEVRQAMCW